MYDVVLEICTVSLPQWFCFVKLNVSFNKTSNRKHTFLNRFFSTYLFKINTGVQNVRSGWSRDNCIGRHLCVIRNEIF